MSNIYKVFNLNNDYTLEDLKRSYNNIKNKLINDDHKSDIEKEILLDKYKQLYRQAKQIFKQNQYYKLSKLDNDSEIESEQIYLDNKLDVFNRFGINQFNHVNNLLNSFNDNKISSFNRSDKQNISTYSYSSSYESKLNNDGSKTVIESKYENKNGDKKNIINAYRKMPNGEIVKFSENEMRELEQKLITK